MPVLLVTMRVVMVKQCIKLLCIQNIQRLVECACIEVVVLRARLLVVRMELLNAGVLLPVICFNSRAAPNKWTCVIRGSCAAVAPSHGGFGTAPSSKSEGGPSPWRESSSLNSYNRGSATGRCLQGGVPGGKDAR